MRDSNAGYEEPDTAIRHLRSKQSNIICIKTQIEHQETATKN